jgi:ABC-2 type transport system ATP-binding protein
MIRVENVTKEFAIYNRGSGLAGALRSLFSRERTIIRAVDHLSLSIGSGEMVGYIGVNGAGKSTSIKLFVGILSPSSGTVRIAGLDPCKQRFENARRIGVVFGQRTKLWWDLPLRESYTLLKNIYDLDKRAYEQQLALLCELLDLSVLLPQPVRTLSLGQRMRADLAASLLHQPAILYLDEPTIGLDPMVKDRIRKAIRTMNQERGTTVMLTTHDLGDIEELCHRIIIVDRGRKIYDGTLQALRETHGAMRIIEMDLADTEPLANVLWPQAIGVPESALAVSTAGNTLVARLDGNVVSAPQLISYVFQRARVLDVRIRDTSVEDIVKRLYA